MRTAALAALVALVSISSVHAAPARRSIFARNNNGNYDDATILNYALTWVARFLESSHRR